MYVHWNSDAIPDMSFEVPQRYHEEAERLLEAVEEPEAFFSNIESYKKDMPLLGFRSIADSVVDVIKECKSDRDSLRCRALRDRLYLKAIHNSIYRYNENELNGNREKTYLEIMGKMDRIDNLLKELG